MLHVVNGDSTAQAIRAAGVLQPLNSALGEHRDPDDVVAWKDVLYDGPVRGGRSPINLAHERSQFIAAKGWEPYISVRQDFGRRDAALASAQRQDEVVFWFESDLYDVLQLAQALDRLAVRRPVETRFSWVLVDRRPDDDKAHGFGHLSRQQVERLLAGRRPVPDSAWPEARAFWAAFTSDDPANLASFAIASPSFPYLADGVGRLLAEYPDRMTGLSRSERQVLDSVSSQPNRTPEDVFKDVGGAEFRPFLGDFQVWDRLERFARADPPLIERSDGGDWVSSRMDLMSLDEPDWNAFRTQPLRLTTAGDDVLAGKRDWLAVGGVGRWIGGYQIPAADASWRFDPVTGGLIASEARP